MVTEEIARDILNRMTKRCTLFGSKHRISLIAIQSDLRLGKHPKLSFLRNLLQFLSYSIHLPKNMIAHCDGEGVGNKRKMMKMYED